MTEAEEIEENVNALMELISGFRERPDLPAPQQIVAPASFYAADSHGDGCQGIVSEDKRHGLVFCGKPTESRASSYCPECKKRIWTPERSRRGPTWAPPRGVAA